MMETKPNTYAVPEWLHGEILELTPAAMEFLNLPEKIARVGLVVRAFDLAVTHMLLMPRDDRGAHILRQIPDDAVVCLKAVKGVFGRFIIV